MSLRFIDPETGLNTGSTELGKAVLASAVKAENLELSKLILNQTDWRKKYQSLFAQVAKAEFRSKNSALNIASAGLEEFEKRVVTDSGELLVQAVKDAWRDKVNLVGTVAITGSGKVEEPKFDALELKALVDNHSAEPEIVQAISELGTSPSQIKDDLFIALAGGAEYSPTRLWLDWGGDVAIIARARVELWTELIARARSSAGTLYVPVLLNRIPNGQKLTQLTDHELAAIAGLDLVKDYREITSWIAQFSRTDKRRIVLGSYAYAPGAKHIEVQAVQHCLARAITEALPKTRVVLSWLATPTDSHTVPAEFADDIQRRYGRRSYFVKLRDVIAGLRVHEPERFSSIEGTDYALIDPTSSMQGSSYALAKRLQRWLAYQQVGADRQVAYIVAPPAKTDSVLSHRILRATYRGGPHFGLFPYETDVAVKVSALLLLSRLQSTSRYSSSDMTVMYSHLAVHGGLWRSIYRPSGLWLAATIRGIWGYFSKH